MSSEPSDEDVKHGIVNVLLKKVCGCSGVIWNHNNPDVSTAVKLTPYRPTFTEEPTERFLPETQLRWKVRRRIGKHGGGGKKIKIVYVRYLLQHAQQQLQTTTLQQQFQRNQQHYSNSFNEINNNFD